jgi:hypothetical protein
LDLNSAFKTTCRLVLSQEIGEMHEFTEYLSEPLIGKQVKSALSGKNLWVSTDYYCKGARFFDYVDESAKFQSKPINPDDIKDIDSLFNAVKENIVYSGSKVLGISTEVENSDHVSDSSSVLNSSIVIKSKFIAYCHLKRNTEYAFACTSSGNSSYILRCFNTTYLKRCFECSDTANSADVYFSYNLIGCNNCMFSFNASNKKNLIGNIQLSQEQYTKLKSKLLNEICEELRAKKKLSYSILNLFGVES